MRGIRVVATAVTVMVHVRYGNAAVDIGIR
jgi:hypothetical protein